MGVGCRFPGLSSLPRPAPVPEGLHRRGQGREQQLRPDLVGQAEGLQPGQQVLLDAGQGEHGAPAGDLLADRVMASSAVKSTSTLASTLSTNQRRGRAAGPRRRGRAAGSPRRWRRTAARRSGTPPGRDGLRVRGSRPRRACPPGRDEPLDRVVRPGHPDQQVGHGQADRDQHAVQDVEGEHADAGGHGDRAARCGGRRAAAGRPARRSAGSRRR